MSAQGASQESAGRAAFLERMLSQDPQNPRLLFDTAEAALGEGRIDLAAELIERIASLGPLSPPACNLAGLVAMRRMDWDQAVERFQQLISEGADAPAVRFNLAWSLAMQGVFEPALAQLDESVSAALPQAAQLEIQLLHQLGRFEVAAARAPVLLSAHLDHVGLNAAVSTLAIDLDDAELAMRAAAKAGDHPDALVTRGTLALLEESVTVAAPLFDAALVRQPQSPRALIGRGLVHLLGDRPQSAAMDLDRGAELFETHIGTWLAAGWAFVIAGDLAAARIRFERALALDDRFAEAQASVGVVDILEGRIEEARRRIEVAQRLERNSFAAAFGAMLLAAGSGDTGETRRIFERAIRQPFDGRGATIADAIVRMGIRG